MHRGIVPPFLLARIAESGDERVGVAADAARKTLLHDQPQWRSARLTLSVEDGELVAELGDAPNRTVCDAQHKEALPGEEVRGEGDAPVQDLAVNEAYDGLGATFDLFSEIYGRNSIDAAGSTLDATVHYGDLYDNAFWNGERMVFGDGDGEVFERFTASVTVIGHELTHGVTEHTAGLAYRDQAGALNESMSDVFGVLVEQYANGETAEQASWLIGAELFTDEVEGRALRDMAAPGTAFDDDVLGTDPQPAHMRDYVDTTDDNGGVHINSGIPNKAFHLVATTLGGRAWERAGRIWYLTLTGGDLAADSDFAAFAAATLATAVAEYGGDSAEADAVRVGWSGVGVTIDGGSER